MTDTNARQMLYEEQQALIEQDMSPFGFVDDGIPDHEKTDRRIRYGMASSSA